MHNIIHNILTHFLLSFISTNTNLVIESTFLRCFYHELLKYREKNALLIFWIAIINYYFSIFFLGIISFVSIGDFNLVKFLPKIRSTPQSIITLILFSRVGK